MKYGNQLKIMNGLYEVSNLGNIRSLDRIVKDTTKNRTQKIKGKILKYCDNGKGYKLVYLFKGSKRRNFYVHRLVACHFIDNPNNYKEINHKDLNKSNNSVENLEWVTQIENIRHYRNTSKAKEIDIKHGKQSTERYRKLIEDKIPLVIDLYQKQQKTILEINKITKIGQRYIKRLLVENDIQIRKKEIILEFNGESHNFKEWSEILKIPIGTIKDRYKNKFTIEKILSTNYLKRRGHEEQNN